MTNHIRRAWCAAASILMLAMPAVAATLSYTGNTTTGAYNPGYLDFAAENNNATRNDGLQITQNIFAPDALHVVFLGGSVVYGHISAASQVDAGPLQVPTPFGFGSNLTLTFRDTLTVIGASSGVLGLDVSVDGLLQQGGADGDFAIGRFGVFTENIEETQITNFGQLCMAWLGPDPPGYCTQNPIGPLAPLKAAMTITPNGLGGVDYQGHATILLPFTVSTFEFSASLTASSLCQAPCLARADLSHTALIGGYQILDSSLAPIPGATLTSQSGYDYVTPPGAASTGVPEPGSAILTVGILGMMLARRRR